jgi:hypothetical protein
MSSLPDPRSIEQALADLRRKHEKHPDSELARMIRQIAAEIAIPERRAKGT